MEAVIMEALAQQCDSLLVKSLVRKTMTSYLALMLRFFITNGDHKLHCSTVNSLSCIFHLIIIHSLSA